jgi:hypothetical protein
MILTTLVNALGSISPTDARRNALLSPGIRGVVVRPQPVYESTFAPAEPCIVYVDHDSPNGLAGFGEGLDDGGEVDGEGQTR